MSSKRQQWLLFKPRLSIFSTLPYPVFMKAKDLPPLGKIIGHKHNWDQLVYAVSGLLEVNSINGDHLIPSGQAIWIPANQLHSIASIHGAQLRSVHLQKGLIKQLDKEITVLKVDNLVRELITKASEFPFSETINATFSKQQIRLLNVLVDEIAQLEAVPLCLPLSNDALLLPILIWQQQKPESNKTLQMWSEELGASTKTIARRFDSKLGISFSKWREQLRLHKAIQWLSEKRPVTDVALSLGYDSLPAFIQMFKRQTGTTPGKFIKN
ncbi:AraC family transcriptional regulator [Pseudoalteromonas denitrificans]|uniref:AraC-type DNA-binding protein n=1 Tax=Pseudoalteromonas denitrificans DSM 6059 TaxID=1123010 RepID=A0A1I1Q6A2_9GAMM|nr:helix-turn-helix transcriptional regulator [Pseudoalteromonas denitrificans]SFD14753.1 AraC-type DNA-binding protein [Pseudoalteromonas denitrificans DSM 6059]